MSEEKMHNSVLVTRVKRIGMAILVVGLLSAILVFALTTDAPVDASGYEIINGVSYPVDVNNTKSYNTNMERIAGKSAVFATDLNDWFFSLWHGKKLSYTLAIISIAASLLFFWLAHLLSLPPLEGEDDQSGWKG